VAFRSPLLTASENCAVKIMIAFPNMVTSFEGIGNRGPSSSFSITVRPLYATDVDVNRAEQRF
jgi:hypothetical protein